MKTILLGILSITFFFSPIFSQNITGTLGTNGTFTIKDGSNIFFTLTQSNGQVNILRNLRIENTTGSGIGVITKGTDRFLHNYGSANTFLGIYSGNFSLTGTNNSGVGYNSLTANTTGYSNSSFGVSSMYYNNTGFENSAFGVSSLQSNTTGSDNAAFGFGSLYSNNTGNNNSGFGWHALYNNTSGYYNSAVGLSTLYANTTGYMNSAIGYQALGGNTTGYTNSALGVYSLNNVTTGSNNTAIGYNALVPSATTSNQVRIGNTNVTYAGVQVSWTITSDRRWKQNILSSNLGLNFISKLNPVYYTRVNDENQKIEYGFIGQEVDSLLKEFGIDASGMITVTDEGKYELRYNDLFAPIVKAIQELKAKNENLETENIQLRNKMNEMNLLNDRLTKLESILKDKTKIMEVSEQK